MAKKAAACFCRRFLWFMEFQCPGSRKARAQGFRGAASTEYSFVGECSLLTNQFTPAKIMQIFLRMTISRSFCFTTISPIRCIFEVMGWRARSGEMRGQLRITDDTLYTTCSTAIAAPGAPHKRGKPESKTIAVGSRPVVFLQLFIKNRALP